MIQSVDLNADLGEGFGPWPMGDDAALMQVITSANIACGFHAGDADVMATTMAQAQAAGIGIGAHPGLPDLQGFGRREMAISPDSAAHLVRYQLGAAQAMARGAGGRVRHLKLHGALANMAARDPALARACYEGALAVDPAIILIVIAATAQERAARDLNARMAREIFADRAYAEDATLLPRSQPGAVIYDADTIVARLRAMLRAGAIISAGGTHIPTQIDTVCLHGDTPGAAALALRIRAGLEAGGIALRRFEGHRDA